MHSYVSRVCVCALQKKLTTLDIAANRIKKIENISHLTELQEFWVGIKVGRRFWVELKANAFIP